MIGQCRLIPIASVSGAAWGAVQITIMWIGQSRLIATIAAVVTPDSGDFAFMKGDLKTPCKRMPSGKMAPEKAAAV